MKKTLHPIPVADLADEVWTINHIAAHMRMRPSAAYARIRRAGFPEGQFGAKADGAALVRPDPWGDIVVLAKVTHR